MDILLFYKISSLVNALVATVLSFVIYFRNRKQLANKLFSLFFAFVAIWAYSYFVWFISKNEKLILFNFKFILTGASVFIPILFFHSILAFIEKIKEYRKLLIGGYVFFLFFLLIDYFTPFLLLNFDKELFFNFWPRAGILFPYFLILWYFYFIFTSYILSIKLKSISNDFLGYKTQLKYILTGGIIGFIGSISNYLLWHGGFVVFVAPFANFLVAVGMIIIALGIIKHQLFNVKLLVSEVLVFAIWAVVVVRTVLSNNNSELLINGILVFLVLVAGILLLRSVSKEKELIQKLLEETQKTLDLEWSTRDEFTSKAKRLIEIMESAVDESEEINKKLKKKSK